MTNTLTTKFSGSVMKLLLVGLMLTVMTSFAFAQEDVDEDVDVTAAAEVDAEVETEDADADMDASMNYVSAGLPYTGSDNSLFTALAFAGFVALIAGIAIGRRTLVTK